MTDLTPTVWRKSSRSQTNGACVEVGCLHDATWRRSSRSGTNGNCVEATGAPTPGVAIRDSKLDATGDFPHLTISATNWAGFLAAVRSGNLIG